MKDDSTQKAMARELAVEAAKVLDNKKGMDVTVLEVSDQTVLADYFVLATGTSNTHVRALADEVEFELRNRMDVSPSHIEGAEGNVWTLLDYGCVVIHVFTKQGRDFYKLERLWSGNETTIFNGSEE